MRPETDGSSRHTSSRDPRDSRDHGHVSSQLSCYYMPVEELILTPLQSSRSTRGDDHRSHDRPPRRRSRSPHRASSRRDYEIDSYSSSRDYREREREDRYRDRREPAREWDRDRGPPQRDPRRPDGDRPPPAVRSATYLTTEEVRLVVADLTENHIHLVQAVVRAVHLAIVTER